MGDFKSPIFSHDNYVSVKILYLPPKIQAKGKISDTKLTSPYSEGDWNKELMSMDYYATCERSDVLLLKHKIYGKIYLPVGWRRPLFQR